MNVIKMVDKEKRKMIIKGLAGTIAGVATLAMLKSVAADWVIKVSGKEHRIGSSMYIDGSLHAQGTITAPIVTTTTLNGTLGTAAQPNITSLGILTSLQVDDINLNGSLISTVAANTNLTLITAAIKNIVLDANMVLVDHVEVNNELTTCELNVVAFGVPVYIKQNTTTAAFFEYCGDDATVFSTNINCCKTSASYTLCGALKVLVDGNIKWMKFFGQAP